MDKKAKEILIKTFWRSGWVDKPILTGEDFEYAKSKGVMFDPITINHDECVKKLILLKQNISKEQVVNAFLSSLSSRKLYLRSAISSWHNANKIIPHHFLKNENISYLCDVCDKVGLSSFDIYKDYNLNTLNFERVMWGGVRHNNNIYCMLDLELFTKINIDKPNSDDFKILYNIIDIIDNISNDSTPRKLEQELKNVFPSNKNERSMLIEILAELDILAASKYRKGPSNDWHKAEHWRGEDRYNKNIFNYYFKF